MCHRLAAFMRTLETSRLAVLRSRLIELGFLACYGGYRLAVLKFGRTETDPQACGHAIHPATCKHGKRGDMTGAWRRKQARLCCTERKTSGSRVVWQAEHRFSTIDRVSGSGGPAGLQLALRRPGRARSQVGRKYDKNGQEFAISRHCGGWTEAKCTVDSLTLRRGKFISCLRAAERSSVPYATLQRASGGPAVTLAHSATRRVFPTAFLTYPEIRLAKIGRRGQFVPGKLASTRPSCGGLPTGVQILASTGPSYDEGTDPSLHQAFLRAF
ncbi:hypothetical protein Bbelb_095760 [Branchiostoma belcheri]|nr:hypothetical protein Bbelb_095760 [Branchiostoma belcheri]